MLLKIIAATIISFSLFSYSLLPALSQEEQPPAAPQEEQKSVTPFVDPFLGPLAYIGMKGRGHGSGFFLTANVVVTAKHVARMIMSDPDGQYIWDSKGGRHRIVKIELSYDADLAVIFIDNPDPQQQTAEISCEMPIRLQTLLAAGHPNLYENITSPVMVVGYTDIRDTDDTTSVVVAGTLEGGMSGGPLYNSEGKVVGVVASSFALSVINETARILSQFTNITPMFGSELCNKKPDSAPVEENNPLPPEETLPGGGA